MADTRTLSEKILDVVVYLPIGVASSASEIIPQLAEKGRSTVAMARMIGQMAVEHGPAEAGKAFDQASKKAMSKLRSLVRLGALEARPPSLGTRPR